MRLYHGSNVVVESPRLIVHNRALDFGAGFYTTSNLDQAVKFSLKVAARRGGEPVVNIYEYDDSNPDCLSVDTFDNPCEDWLNFVTLNRSSENVECPFDVVVGPVANDDVYTTIQLYLTGFLSMEQAIVSLRAKKLFDQYVFKTDRGLSRLTFVGVHNE